jgi:hypothetical protein
MACETPLPSIIIDVNYINIAGSNIDNAVRALTLTGDASPGR